MEGDLNQKSPNLQEGKVQAIAEKYFLFLFFALIGVVVVVTFIKYFILKDYYIKAEAECDPTAEACFIYECDPAEEEDCPEDEAERISYYKSVLKKAYLIMPVNSEAEEEPDLICQEWEKEECEEILCNEETKGEGEECNDPVKYLEENPLEEETDEECLESDDDCVKDDLEGETGGETTEMENNSELESYFEGQRPWGNDFKVRI